MIGGMNDKREWTLRPRKVQMHRFRDWAAKNFKPGDAVVIETTSNVWDIYDTVAALVSKTVVANAHKVRQIAEARVKTDKEDVKRLLTLLIADIVPEVWVPPMHVRELRSLISFRWRLSKQITMSKNRLHSVIQRFNLTPQFTKYGLLQLGVGENLTRIVRNGVPRRIAPAAEVLALKPELQPSR